MREPEKPSYNDAMAEWSAKQSFFRNRANRIIHPDPDSSIVLRTIGYLWRLGLLGLLFLFAAFFVLKKQIASPKFSKQTALNLAETLNASDEDLEFKGLRWSGSTARSGRFKAIGTEDAFFHDIEMRAIEFEASRLALARSKWVFKRIRIDELRVKLRSGGKVEVKELTQARPGAGPLQLAAAGFLRPEADLARARFSKIKVRSANFFWGREPSTLGALTGSEMEFTPGRTGETWKLEFKGGRLDQNWWKDVGLIQLTIRREPGKLIFENGELQLEAGKGFLSGEIATGAIPRFDLRLEFADLPAGFITPRPYANYFSSVVLAGTDHIKGSINLSTGVEHHVDVTVQRGSVEGFPALNALALITKHIPFRRFNITEGQGSFNGYSKGGVFHMESLDLTSAGHGRILAQFEVEDPRVRASAAILPGLQKPEEETEEPGEKPKPAAYEFKGLMEFGASKQVVDEPDLPLAKKYLTEDRDRHLWMKIEVDGPLQPLLEALMQNVRRDLPD